MSRPPGALFLSPHLDDAAFSAGGLAALLAARGWRVVIATAFTASVPRPRGFALACQTDKGVPADADYMAIRRDEDAEACAALGAEPLWLGEPEAPHRGYDTPCALFAGPRADDTARARLAARLPALLEAISPRLVLAPEGIGGHVDHLALRGAVADAAAGWSRALLLWRDQPYAARIAAPVPDDALAVAVAEGLPAKIRAATAHATQLGFQFGGAAGTGPAIRAAAEADAAGRDVPGGAAELYSGSPAARARLAGIAGLAPPDAKAARAARPMET